MSATSTICPNHDRRAATIRCDDCGRRYCRQCVGERWITSRSSVWVCRRCTGTWRPTSTRSGGGTPRLAAALTRVLPIAVVVAIVALAAAAQRGGLGL
jgi:hypothetical protein